MLNAMILSKIVPEKKIKKIKKMSLKQQYLIECWLEVSF